MRSCVDQRHCKTITITWTHGIAFASTENLNMVEVILRHTTQLYTRIAVRFRLPDRQEGCLISNHEFLFLCKDICSEKPCVSFFLVRAAAVDGAPSSYSYSRLRDFPNSDGKTSWHMAKSLYRYSLQGKRVQVNQYFFMEKSGRRYMFNFIHEVVSWITDVDTAALPRPHSKIRT